MINPVNDDSLIDVEALGDYLATQLPQAGRLLDAEKFADGQSNPTFALTTDRTRFVLRRKPPGELLRSAHAVDREYRVQQALAGSDVPVARMFHLCEDESVIGSVFYVMEYVDGRTFWEPSLPGLEIAERSAIYDSMNATLVAIHRVDVDAIGLGDFGRPGNYFERQFDRWSRQYRASETETIDAMETLIDWLDKNMVADDGRYGLVHGDYRLDNIMMHATEPRAIAVMDWELSTLGHPFADLAYQCMLWRMPPGPLLGGLDGIERGALGIPTEAEYVARYCERMGLERIEHWLFYLVFGFFRIAAIAQGVYQRALQGNASSERALELGRLARPLAEKARDLLNDPAQVEQT